MKCRKKMSKNTSKKTNPLAQAKTGFQCCKVVWQQIAYFTSKPSSIPLFFPIYKPHKFCQGSNKWDFPIATQVVKRNVNILKDLVSSMV